LAIIAFWNINKRNRQGVIGDLVREYAVDIVALAECEIEESYLLYRLNVGQERKYYRVDVLPSRVKIYSRYDADRFKPIRDSGGVTIRHLSLPGGEGVLLVAVHLPSRLYRSEGEQYINTAEVAEKVVEAEHIVGHRRTIVFGDFNMNPFEMGMVGAGAMHAVMDRRIAEKGARVVAGKRYSFFYNPMWGKMGDVEDATPGTYYYNSGTELCVFWNMFDQVIVRPELLKDFDPKKLKIVTRVGKKSLVSESGIPRRSVASDHLPILFEVRIGGIEDE
jgi:endonuclease/exonuclease/phosphatase family metal-dependent hydrolase